jgi:hypothetical protein
MTHAHADPSPVHRTLRTPVLWGLLFGALQAASPLGFWWLPEITGVLKLADGWPAGQRTLARTEPLHPKHRKQASEIEKRRGQRFQALATDLPGNHYPKLDALHRNHTGVQTVIKDAENLGLKRLPSYYLAFNQARCIAVAIASDPPGTPGHTRPPRPGHQHTRNPTQYNDNCQ